MQDTYKKGPPAEGGDGTSIFFFPGVDPQKTGLGNFSHKIPEENFLGPKTLLEKEDFFSPLPLSHQNAPPSTSMDEFEDSSSLQSSPKRSSDQTTLS